MKIYKISLFAFVFIIAFSNTLRAQVNTEALRKQFMNDTITNSLSASYQIADGNSEYVGLSIGYRLDCLYDRFYSFLNTSLEYKRAKDKSIVDKGFAHLRIGYNINKLFGVETFYQKEFNKFILLKDRNLIGAGLRLRVDKIILDTSKNNFEFIIGSGIMAENEILSLDTDSSTNAIRTTNYFNLHYNISNTVSFSTILYYQASLANFQNFRLLNDSKFSFKITEYLSFYTSLNYRYNNTAHFDLKKYDIYIINGLSVSF